MSTERECDIYSIPTKRLATLGEAISVHKSSDATLSQIKVKFPHSPILYYAFSF